MPCSQCGSCKNPQFGGMHRFHHQGDKNRRARSDVSSNYYYYYYVVVVVVVVVVVFLLNVLRLLVTANVVPNSQILVTLMMEAIRSYETSVLTRAKRRHIPDDRILPVSTLFTYYFHLRSRHEGLREELTHISDLGSRRM
jgi:hypothetical protein